MIPFTTYSFLFVELLAVSYIDFKSKKISNSWSLLNISLAILFFFLWPEIYPLTFNSFLYPLLFLVCGFLLFVAKIMGAGDAKYVTTFFLLIPFEIQEQSVLLLLKSTVLVALVLLMINTYRNFANIRSCLVIGEIKKLKKYYGSKFPYAPVIMLSWIWLGIYLYRGGEK